VDRILRAFEFESRQWTDQHQHGGIRLENIAEPMVAEAFPRVDGVLHCENVPMQELVARWGTPLYVYSQNAIRERFRELNDALSPVPHLIAYSVKANGNLGVLRTLAAMGAGADIVSGGELHRALLAGIPPERIVFSGVGKTVIELAAALSAGIYAFNVESEGELCALSDLACAMGTRAPVALRVNPDIDTPTPHAYTRTGHAATKFGIAAARARTLYSIAAKMPGVRVRGIDVHIGSQILEVGPFRQALDYVLDLAHELKREEVELEFLDLGGGLGISYEGGPRISAAEWADEIVPAVAATGLKLVVEPGRFLVGESGALLTRVLYVKEGGGKRFVITDAGMNDLLRPSHYSGWHAVEPVEPHGRARGHVDVVGPICETGDFLALDREMEVPKPGELLAIMTVGAYGFSMSSQYNQRPRPAEVMVDGADATLVRRRETVDDLVAAEMDL
jgi:diaminopimelate decarboxylase